MGLLEGGLLPDEGVLDGLHGHAGGLPSRLQELPCSCKQFTAQEDTKISFRPL